MLFRADLNVIVVWPQNGTSSWPREKKRKEDTLMLLVLAHFCSPFSLLTAIETDLIAIASFLLRSCLSLAWMFVASWPLHSGTLNNAPMSWRERLKYEK